MARSLHSAAQRTSVRFGLSEDLAAGPRAGARFEARDWQRDLLDFTRSDAAPPLELSLDVRTASALPTAAAPLALAGLEAAADADLRDSLDLGSTTAFENLSLRCGCAYCLKGVDAFPDDGVGSRFNPDLQPLLVTVDVHPDDTSTSSVLTVDGPHIISTLDTIGDQDFFQIELEAGQYYDIGMYLVAAGPSGVPLADAYIELYDADGELIVSADGGGPNTPSGLDALLTYQAEYTGTYYINARAYDQDGTNGTTGDFVGDYELFADTVEPGANVYTPFYSPDSPLYSLDWGSQVDRTVRNPDGDNGPRDNGTPGTGTIKHAQYDIEGKNVITYYFAKQGDVFVDEDPTNPGLATMVAQGMTDWEKEAFEKAFDLYEQVADIVYIEVDNRWEADFKIITYEGTPGVGASLLGRMSPPNEPNEGQTEFNSGDARWTEEGLQQGGFYFPTLLHELGHGHGMAHPHDNGGRSGIMPGADGGTGGLGGGFGDWGLSQQVYTIMSYNDGWNQGAPYGARPAGHGGPRSGGITGTEVDHYGWMGTLAALDIAVLQDKYGVNEEWATGDDVYLLSDENGPGNFYSTIWDAAGVDEIRYQGERDTTIDLRAATLQYEEGGGGRMSYALGVWAGFTIANGVTIENATTGNGDDTLVGNAAANVLSAGHGADSLFGGAGDDTIEGGGGADFMNGGAGIDTLSYAGANGRVVVRLWNETATGAHTVGDVFTGFENVTGSNFNDALIGSAGANVLTGGFGDDLLDGGAGDDVVIGGSGADTMTGGAGVDTLSFEGSSVRVVARLYNNTSTGGHANGDVFSGFENLTGSSHGDTLVGAADANRLTGGDGDDYLGGMEGDDVLVGGAGNDRLNGGLGSDLFDFLGGGGADRILDFGAGDQIRLDAAVFADFEDVLDHASDDGAGNTVISKAGLSITLEGVLESQLAADDFVFGGAGAGAGGGMAADDELVMAGTMPAAPDSKSDDAFTDPFGPRVADDKLAPVWAPALEAQDLGLMDLAVPMDGGARFSRHEPVSPWDWVF